MDTRDVGERIRRARFGLPPVAPVGEDFDATESALDLARSRDFDLRPYAGQGSGPDGRIYKEDVERWLGGEE